jgi:pimeloyl-ACP methyl ester carboxylesterase
MSVEPASIAVPTLAIGAADDPAVAPAHSEAIVSAVLGARLEVLAHGAHPAASECADEVAGLIESHLGEAEP